jgi:hypothetical protein
MMVSRVPEATATTAHVTSVDAPRHEVWADWAQVGATIVGVLALIVTWVLTSRTRKQAINDKRDLFETEILSRLHDTIPDPNVTSESPKPFITNEQFALVSRLPSSTLPFWRDFMVLIGQATADGDQFPLHVGIGSSGKPLVNPQLLQLWDKYGFAKMATAEQVIYWLQRRDIYRALAERTGQDPSEVDAWLVRLTGADSYVPPGTLSAGPSTLGKSAE